MGLGTIGGVAGMIASQGDQNQAQQAQQAALQGILNLNAPTIAEQQVSPTTESVAGTLNPNMQSTAQIGNNAMSGISTDPRLAQAQMQALSQLQQQGQSGFTSAQLAALQSSNQQAAGQAQSANAAVMQNMAARGMGGSGMELAAKLSNSQNAANLANTQGNQLAGQAQQNALAATAASGQLGGQMQQTQFGQQSQIAAAQNAINQFNTANQQNVIGQNTTAQNAAQSANLANAQNVANTNTGLQNQAQYYNKGLYQQQFQNQLGQASAAAGQQNNLSNYYQGQAANTAGMYAGIGAGLQNAATSVATGGMSGIGSGSGSGGQASSGSGLGNLGSLQATANGSATAGWAHGGMIPGYAHGGQVSEQPYCEGGYSNGGLADPEIGYDEGGMSVQQNLEALQSGANAVQGARKAKPVPFDPSKYDAPQYNNAEDAASAGEEETANSAAGSAYAKYRQENGLYNGGRVSDNYGAMGMADGGQVNQRDQDLAPSQAYLQHMKDIGMKFPTDTYSTNTPKPGMELPGSQQNKDDNTGMFSGGRVNVNNDSTDDTNPNVAFAAQGLNKDYDSMTPEELEVQMKHLKYVLAKKKLADGGQVESMNSSQKTLGAAIGYPGSQPSPQPSPEPKNFKAGGSVPGKAKVPGDSPRNDTVHAKLSPGELVIPRSIVGAGDEAIMDFVKHVMKKNERK